jgi:hypothetical protein
LAAGLAMSARAYSPRHLRIDAPGLSGFIRI